ncbi:MAG: hypothetical protein GY742_06535 [Hyphomicrobiales bacterium]|nr:hypothetical protein [Hyphomicrobiales bacterium]
MVDEYNDKAMDVSFATSIDGMTDYHATLDHNRFKAAIEFRYIIITKQNKIITKQNKQYSWSLTRESSRL